jgi:hypothetical protein
VGKASDARPGLSLPEPGRYSSGGVSLAFMIALQRNLEPAAFVRSALMCSRADFEQAWGDGVLLVQLDDPTGPVARGLRSGAPGVSATPGGGALTIEDRGALANQAKESWPESLITHQVRSRLVRALNFAVPLVRRTPADDRFFKIGRGRGSDLLLAAESVSKIHARIRRGTDGRYELTDDGSRNGTTVNGKAIAAQRPVLLSPGDILSFGKIDVMLCPTEAVWGALRSPTAAT